ncbi:aminotransferase-like domain-containing protein [Allokutzneria albata]|uniref:DNA-binding transcriptional regulator, MocR family, contains an aminotransferase domain n=1 Tax=Allokutzneria albata TaxID=211114 RepID=A0A1H0B224_ALLAB|nr:PLP-dependent aminotransferase family protein [Allokutzneria albata]SDN39698.1 DNA-binding transcriptional regulator, MocR family, contains an aminotransferase domain [Allokutzneria albata]
MDDYRIIADAIAADIAAGRLRPGERLIPQRQFARRHRIAGSTAARVYGELVRRGLAVGEVGRGTFVRAGKPPLETALAEPGGARVDLELNFSVLPEQPGLLARSMERLMRPDVFGTALQPVVVQSDPGTREIAASLLGRTGWAPSPDNVIFAGNGRQAIAAAIAALVPVGERLGVEALTYPVVKAIAARLGITLVPIPMDSQGIDPDALRAANVRAVYLQPTLHNPLGTSMPRSRREDVADAVRQLGIYAIEDTIYTFLRDEIAPLAALAPERTVLVDSLSKRISPGLTVGFLVAPTDLVDRIAGAVRSGTWAAPGFALAAASCWISDGTAALIASAKRQDAAARQALVRKELSDFVVVGDMQAYHCWWELPEAWRAETFVAAAARRGIAVSPAAAFAVGSGRAPNAVRVATSAPAPDVLATALRTLAALARSSPEFSEIH